MTRLRRLAVGVAVTAVLLTLAFPGILLGGQRLFCGDLFRLYDPVMRFAVARLRGGSLPLWFPYDGTGVPLLGATVAGIFHPDTLLDLALGVPAGLTFGALASVLVAGVSTHHLARRLEAPPFAATAAAVSYALCGPLLGVLDNAPFHRGAAMFPVFLLGLTLARRRRLPGTALAAAAFAFAVLGGDVEAAYLFGPVGVVWVLGIGPPLPVRARLRDLAGLVGVGAAGATLAAAQLVPTWRTFIGTDRGAGLPLSEAGRFSLSPLRLPELFVGGHFAGGLVPGLPTPPASSWVAPGGAWVPSACLGVVVLLGVVLALALGRPGQRRTDTTLLGLGLVLLWLALGRHAALYDLAWRWLPLFRSFRFPAKLVLFAALPLALLSARGLGRAVTRSRRGALAATATVAGVGLLALAGLVLARVAPGGGPAAYGRALARAGAWTTVLGAGAAGALLLPWWRPGLRAARLLLPLLALIQLRGPGSGPFGACTAPPEIFRAPSPVASWIHHEGHDPVGARVTVGFTRAPPGAPMAGVSAAEQYAVWSRAVLLPDHNAIFGVPGTGRYLPTLPAAWTSVIARHPAEWFKVAVPELGSRWLVTSPSDLARLGRMPGRVVVRFPRLDAVLFRYDATLPRTYVAQPLPEPDDQAAYRALLRPDVRQGRRVVVEGPGARPGPPVTGHARTVSESPRQVTIDADLDAPGMVVLADGWDRGWRATVDGRPTAVVRANLLVRAVHVPPGQHRVTFTYPVSRSLRLGLTASGAAWVLLILLLGADLWRRRHAGAGRDRC